MHYHIIITEIHKARKAVAKNLMTEAIDIMMGVVNNDRNHPWLVTDAREIMISISRRFTENQRIGDDEQKRQINHSFDNLLADCERFADSEFKKKIETLDSFRPSAEDLEVFRENKGHSISVFVDSLLRDMKIHGNLKKQIDALQAKEGKYYQQVQSLEKQVDEKEERLKNMGTVQDVAAYRKQIQWLRLAVAGCLLAVLLAFWLGGKDRKEQVQVAAIAQAKQEVLDSLKNAAQTASSQPTDKPKTEPPTTAKDSTEESRKPKKNEHGKTSKSDLPEQPFVIPPLPLQAPVKVYFKDRGTDPELERAVLDILGPGFKLDTPDSCRIKIIYFKKGENWEVNYYIKQKNGRFPKIPDDKQIWGNKKFDKNPNLNLR